MKPPGSSIGLPPKGGVSEKFINSDLYKNKSLEHLESPFLPIMAVIEDSQNVSKETKMVLENIERTGLDINFWSPKDKLTEGEDIPGVVSKCNNESKYSKDFCNCIGLVVAGIDKETNEHISVLAHFTPMDRGFNLNILDEIKDRCKSGSIDAVIFGGYLNDTQNNPNKGFVQIVNDICTEKLRFEPIIATGPNYAVENNYKQELTDVYYDTPNRRLYILRARQELQSLNEPFRFSDYKSQEKKWQQEEDEVIKLRYKINN